jgi:transposase
MESKIHDTSILQRSLKRTTNPLQWLSDQPGVFVPPTMLVLSPKGSTIYSDQFSSYDGVITEGYRHYRINHGEGVATSRRRHINGIENFWGYAKTKLKRYYGNPRSQCLLYLKEMEFRFNHRHEDLPLLIRRILKKPKPVLD